MRKETMRTQAICALILLLAAAFGLLLVTHPPGGRTESTHHGQIWEGTVEGPEGPVVGARVRIQGSRICTRTNAAGRFHLPRGREAASITAWKPGFFIGGRASERAPMLIPLQPLPTEDNDTYSWVDPAPDTTRSGNCGNCHAAIYTEWTASAHAHSATGGHFRNLYEGTDWQGRPDVGWGLVTEHPNGSGVCAACHVPSLTDEEARLDLRKVVGVADQGVHCDYCHKVASVGSRRPGLSHGSFDQRLLRPTDPEHQIFFGPLDDVDRGEDAYEPLYHNSRYCASCHEGIVFGVHVYSTWSEWQVSAAAAAGIQCQDCHMKPTGRMTNFAPGHGGKERSASTLANHRFFDGSLEEMLRRCLHCRTTLVRHKDGLQVRVQLTAEGVGHRVPTGFIDRHLMLVIEGFDAAGGRLTALGGPQLPEAAGDLAGQAGKLYARRLTDFTGRSPAPFWRPVREPDDSRLTVGQPDNVLVELPPEVRRVRVRVVYRRFWQETIRSKGWPDSDLVVHDESIAAPIPF
jgi:hypothetical protein